MKNISDDSYRFTYENRLILFTSLDCRTSSHIDNAIYSSIRAVSDWEYVFKYLMHHGTLITFSNHITRLQLLKYIPDNYSEHLCHTVMVLRYRNIRFFEEMKKIATLFPKYDVPLVFIKGSMLLVNGYYDAESRFMEDMDCIVPEESMIKAKELLESIHYIELNSNSQAIHYQHKREMQFVNSQDREIIVELATKLNKNHELTQCYPFHDDELKNKISRKTVDGVMFFEIEKEFHFVYCLFHHVSLNYLHRLNWLNDLYLMAADKEVNFEEINRYLDEYGLRKSWNLLNNIFHDHYHMQFEISLQRVPVSLQKIFLTDSCHFVNLEEIELSNVSIRFLLINNLLNKVKVVFKKILLPTEWLKDYYKLNQNTSSLAVYSIHYINSIKRFMKIRS